MSQLLDQVLENYFGAHKELIAAESDGENDVVVSFPFHYVGNHRVEISITEVMGGQLVRFRMGRTIGELKVIWLRRRAASAFPNGGDRQTSPSKSSR